MIRMEPVEETERWEQEIWRRLSWSYPHQQTTQILSKTSVTELKRLSEHHKLMELLSEEPAVPVWPAAATEASAEAGSSYAVAGAAVPASGGFYRPAIVRRPVFSKNVR
ncbi:hypothetical protein LJK88_19405 [Paenibacillus sp. P26]|nr:hypothetical protein LJK88_19405 [Paenibacillus sp. P26]